MSTNKLPVPNTTLQQRAEDVMALWKLLEETGGETCETLDNWLIEVQKNLATKIDSYKFIQDTLAAESSRLMDESKRLRSAAESIDKVSERLKDRIKITMVALGVDELKGAFYRFKMTKMEPKLVLNEAEIPMDLKIPETTTVYKSDKDKIRALLQLNEFIPGAKLEDVYRLNSYISKGDKS